MVDRIKPPMIGDELTLLTAWLEFHRTTLVDRCEGLSGDQLRDRTVPPSNLSLLGLVRHMTEVERYWFRVIFLGEEPPDLYVTDAEPDGDFECVADTDPALVFAVFAEECDRSRQVVAGAASLDAVAAAKRRGDAVGLRWILIHMVEEYARHNGHADLLRERIDGTVGW